MYVFVLQFYGTIFTIKQQNKPVRARVLRWRVSAATVKLVWLPEINPGQHDWPRAQTSGPQKSTCGTSTGPKLNRNWSPEIDPGQITDPELNQLPP